MKIKFNQLHFSLHQASQNEIIAMSRKLFEELQKIVKTIIFSSGDSKNCYKYFVGLKAEKQLITAEKVGYNITDFVVSVSF